MKIKIQKDTNVKEQQKRHKTPVRREETAEKTSTTIYTHQYNTVGIAIVPYRAYPYRVYEYPYRTNPYRE